MLMNRTLLANLLEGRCDEASLADAALDDRVARALLTLGWPDGGHGAVDGVAAELYEIFGRCVFPFEGVFLDPAVAARGSLAEALRASHRAPTLVHWIPAFCCSLKDLRRPLATALADVIQELLLETEGGVRLPSPMRGIAPDLDHAETDLRELIAWLSTPSRCGLFLSSGAIGQIARTVDVPRGFGPRGRLLRQLIDSATRFGRLDAVLGGLGLIVARHRETLSAAPYQTPALQAATAPWRERLETTQRLLGEIAGRAAAVPGPEARA